MNIECRGRPPDAPQVTSFVCAVIFAPLSARYCRDVGDAVPYRTFLQPIRIFIEI